MKSKLLFLLITLTAILAPAAANAQFIYDDFSGQFPVSIQGQGTTADTLGRMYTEPMETKGWQRITLQYQLTAGDADSLRYKVLFQWSNNKTIWYTLAESPLRIANGATYMDSIAVYGPQFYREIFKPELGGDSSSAVTGSAWRCVKGADR